MKIVRIILPFGQHIVTCEDHMFKLADLERAIFGKVTRTLLHHLSLRPDLRATVRQIGGRGIESLWIPYFSGLELLNLCRNTERAHLLLRELDYQLDLRYFMPENLRRRRAPLGMPQTPPMPLRTRRKVYTPVPGDKHEHYSPQAAD